MGEEAPNLQMGNEAKDVEIAVNTRTFLLIMIGSINTWKLISPPAHFIVSNPLIACTDSN